MKALITTIFLFIVSFSFSQNKLPNESEFKRQLLNIDLENHNTNFMDNDMSRIPWFYYSRTWRYYNFPNYTYSQIALNGGFGIGLKIF